MSGESENVRRSSRSNKGIHSKRLETEIIESDEPRKKLKVKSSDTSNRKHSQPAYVKIDGESVRCLPCGTTDLNYNEEDDDPNGMMIECDNCHTWQHVKCMFGSKLKKNQIPNDYKCDICDPLNPRYNNLKRKLSYARYLKLRLGNTNNDNDNDNDNSIIGLISSDEDEFVESGAVNEEDDVDYKDIDNKSLKISKGNSNILSDDDKLSDDNENNDINKDKSIGIIHKLNKKKVNKKKIKSPEIEKDDKSKANNTYTYDNIRSRIVKNLELKLVELLPKTNNESILKGKTIGELAKEWAVKLEKEIHEMFPNYQVDHLKYTEKARSLLTNLKISRLVDRVIEGEFTIEQLPKLTTEEMRTPEEKKKAEEFMQKALDQVVIKNDVSKLPKTRLTHRGEEIIGDTDYQFDINDKRINEVERIKEKKRAEEINNKTSNESKDSKNVINFHENIGKNIQNNGKYIAALSNESDDDDDENMLSNDLDNNEILDDDEFDNILNDNTKNKEKEDVQKEKSKEIEIKPKKLEKRIMKENKIEYSKFNLWSGKIGSPELSFKCKIDFIGSTSKSSKILENAFKMINENAYENNNEYINKGRLKSHVADEYLDKITTSRDLYLFNVKPDNLDDEENQNKFIKLWTYYHSSSRYAVIKNSLSYIKDIYLLALSREKIIDGEEGAITLNNFSSDILMDHLDQDEEECKLYLIFVVQKNMDNIRSINKRVTDNNNNNNNKERDDDYDPALSVTLSKLTNSGKEDNQENADSALKNLMKKLG